MAVCTTDCIEKPLRIFFESIGYFIGSHPWWFFVTPFLLSAVLGSGFYFLNDNISNDIEKQFTPLNGQAKTERHFIQERFPQNDAMFSSLRLSTDGNYATFIATNDSNVLSVECLQEIILLDRKIRNISQFENITFEYVEMCSKVNGSCLSNDFLDIIGFEASNIESILDNLTFPWYLSELGMFPLYSILGSVKLGSNNSTVLGAEAIQLHYYLQEHDKTDAWLRAFIDLLSNESTTSVKVSYCTSKSMQWEFEETPAAIVDLFAITYTITITFTVTSCMRLDNVRNKLWVAAIGVISTGLAVLSSFGLLLYTSQPFVMTVASSPFMILGIGIDDMFIMLSGWQRTSVLDSVPDRLADTFRDAAVSVSITTLTDALALFLGYSSPFGSVQSFCVYAGTAIAFCFFYNVTLLGAFLALNGQREAGNRHWLTCAKVPQDLPPGKSKVYALCCVGGAYNQSTNTEEDLPISRFFKKYYGPFITHKWTKVCVTVIYVGYLSVSCFGCSRMKEGIDLRTLALDNSYIIKYYDSQSQHFWEYGPNVMVAVNETFPYWSEEGRRSLSSCISSFEEQLFVQNSSSHAWFLSFQLYANRMSLNITSENDYKKNLLDFLEVNPMFRMDVNFSAVNQIQSSRFFIQTLNNTSEKELLIGLRATAKGCPVKLLVYHPSFIYHDQYTVIMENTIQNVLTAMVAMLAVALILIPNPFCSLWVTATVCSVIVGVAGFMALWDVNLNSISMINLIICIGFSIDFAAHVSYAFVTTTKRDVNEKVVEALAHLGYPILQGGLTTILGVVVLSVAGNYIFRTFFKIIFLAILFGMVHGLVFIPVFLTLFNK